jgi:FkbM family methyltransferase
MSWQTINFKNQKIQIETIDRAGESVAAEIFKYREYRRAEKIISETKLPILDVGAHAGLFAIYCRLLNPVVQIIALEPENKNFTTLKQNLEINNIENIKVEKVALAGETGERYLSVSEDSHNHALSNQTGENGQRVAAKSLADLIRGLKINKIGLLKMDIEGGEGEVIRSLTSREYKKIESIIFEYHDKIISHAILETLLRENGFGVESFPSKFDKSMGFVFARNKRINK